MRALPRPCATRAFGALLRLKSLRPELKRSRKLRKLSQRAQVFEKSVKTLWHHNSALAASLERDLERFLTYAAGGTDNAHAYNADGFRSCFIFEGPRQPAGCRLAVYKPAHDDSSGAYFSVARFLTLPS